MKLLDYHIAHALHTLYVESVSDFLSQITPATIQTNIPSIDEVCIIIIFIGILLSYLFIYLFVELYYQSTRNGACHISNQLIAKE